jgi:1,4-alpha-glucan branching enzyme
MGSEAGDVKAPSNLTDHAITDFDLYLFGEGKHERIYDKLGAHLYASAAASAAASPAAGAAAGTRFAVWAPNAERVSVVGAFNQWNGDAHVMQGRGSSGIWELAIPGIGAGTA